MKLSEAACKGMRKNYISGGFWNKVVRIPALKDQVKIRDERDKSLYSFIVFS